MQVGNRLVSQGCACIKDCDGSGGVEPLLCRQKIPISGPSRISSRGEGNPVWLAVAVQGFCVDSPYQWGQARTSSILQSRAAGPRTPCCAVKYH